MNTSEDQVAEEMTPELHGGGYLLGDGEYNANAVYDAAGAAGYQLVGPAGGRRERGWGITIRARTGCGASSSMRSAFGRGVFACRGRSSGPSGPDVVWRRVVAASVVGAAPGPGVALGRCEAGDQRSESWPTQRTCGINAISWPSPGK